MSGLDKGGRASAWPHWSTPLWFMDLVRAVAPVGLDPCPNAHAGWGRQNISAEQDSLRYTWRVRPGEIIFMNPPYGRLITPFVEKLAGCGYPAIALLPASTDAAWMHDHVFAKTDAWLLWRGRIDFDNPPPTGASTTSVKNLVALYRGRGGPATNYDLKVGFGNVFGPYGELAAR